MKRKNKKHFDRIKKLIVACGLCAVILTVSTYAWFIGMKTVNVSTLNVKIAAIDSLSLSLDGSTWSDEIDISSTTYSSNSYVGNKNSWGGDGLIPISTVGEIDAASSRLILYEKGSLTTTKGGYRLMASQVKNTGGDEQPGYVAFDLFIKNLSGNEYYKDFNINNEEAIYLTLDSEVIEKEAGTNGSGIENSVRVAFAQIGRVIATTTDVGVITGITCQSDTNVTGICTRAAQIWEPNDSTHVQNALNWYSTSCGHRNLASMSALNAYDAYGTCETIGTTDYVPTYAIADVIDHTDQVDVYDGLEYNGYEGSVNSNKLVAFDYFRDTEKNYKGVDRPTFINLAPNSITKVRIYVYIEGQDIDNYDFASLGQTITVNFGFTKERFFDDDIDYEGPTLPADVVRPTTQTVSP